LPEDLKLTKVTPHGFGRRTHISTSVNGGTDPTVVAFASKHKDPTTKMRYIDVDNATLCRSALNIANVLNKHKSSSSYAGFNVDLISESDDDNNFNLKNGSVNNAKI